MGEVTVGATATEEITAPANKVYTVTDSSGRVIELKKPSVLAQFRLVELMGDTAKNQVYMSMVLPLMFVTSIDGDVVFQCSKKSEVEALITRLDEHGVAAVVNGVLEHFGGKSIEEEQAAVKK